MKRATRFMILGVLCVTAPGLAWSAESKKIPKPPPQERVRGQRSVPETVMFSIDELNEIQTRTTSTKNPEAGDTGRQLEAIESASLYLSTIVFYGPKDWLIWVNGVPITPKEDFPSFKVTDIGPSFVELLVPLSAQGMQPVRLAPNQSFVAKTGAVVEGQWKE